MVCTRELPGPIVLRQGDYTTDGLEGGRYLCFGTGSLRLLWSFVCDPALCFWCIAAGDLQKLPASHTHVLVACLRARMYVCRYLVQLYSILLARGAQLHGHRMRLHTFLMTRQQEAIELHTDIVLSLQLLLKEPESGWP